MKKWLIKNKLIFIGSFIGGAFGFLYYYFIGCSNGSCAIKSSPIISTLYGVLMGVLFFNIFESKKTAD
jgi:ABC-type Fe3+-siderophore transport system permease subunit